MSTPALSLRTDPDESERDGVAVDERTEADALHGAGDAEERACAIGPARSADPRQRVADEHVDDAGAAEGRAQHDDAFGLGGDLADRAPRRRRADARAWRASAASASSAGDDGHDLALVGDVERVDAEQVARAVDRREHGQRRLRRARPRARCRAPARWQTVPTPPRVGSRIQRVFGAAASSARTRSPSGAVSERMSASSARSPRASITAMPWSAMVPDTSTTVARRARCVGAELAPGGITPTPGSGDEQPVGRAPADDLGVAGDDLHAGGRGGLGHVGDDLAQLARPGSPLRSRTPPTATPGSAPCTARSFTVPCTAR